MSVWYNDFPIMDHYIPAQSHQIQYYYQRNNLIYCLECNICNTKYAGQPRDRIIDRLQSHLFDSNVVVLTGV